MPSIYSLTQGLRLSDSFVEWHIMQLPLYVLLFHHSIHSMLGSAIIKLYNYYTLVRGVVWILYFGLIGPSTLETTTTVADILTSLEVPQVLISPDTSYIRDKAKYSYAFHSTTRTITNYITAVIEVIVQLNWTYIIVFSSPTIYGRTLMNSFQNQIYLYDVCIATVEELPATNIKSYQDVLIKVKNLGIQSILVFASNFEIKMLFGAAKNLSFNSFHWLVSDTFSITQQNLIGLENIAAGMLTIQPIVNEIPEFKQYFLDLITGKVPPNNLLMKYISEVYECDLPNQNLNCKSLKLREIQAGYVQDPGVEYVINAIYLYATALRNAHTTLCSNQYGLCRDLMTITPKIWREYLKKVSYTYRSEDPTSLLNKTISFFTTYQKRQMDFDYRVYHYKRKNGTLYNFVQVGSSFNGHLFVEINSLRSYFPNGSERPRNAFKYPASRCPYKICECVIETITTPVTSNQSFLIVHWRADTWITVVTTVAVTGIIFTLVLLIYIVYNIFAEKMKGNQMVAILLLLGIIMLYLSVVPYGFQPSETTCGLRIVTVGFSYSFCFSIMLSRIIMLIAVESEDSISGHISGFVQIILFFFMLLVQIAISIQYWLLKFPRVHFVYNDDNIEIKCLINMLDFLVSLVYVKFLLFLLCLTSLFTVGEKRTYREGLLFNISSLIAVGLWIAWTVVYGVAKENYKEASVCIGLLSIASTLLVTTFFPRIYMIISSSTIESISVPISQSSISRHHNHKTMSFDNNTFDDDSDDDKTTRQTKL